MKIKVRIHKASDWDYEEYKIFNNLRDLIEYLKTFDSWVISVEDGEKYSCDYFICLLKYDDYIE